MFMCCGEKYTKRYRFYKSPQSVAIYRSSTFLVYLHHIFALLITSSFCCPQLAPAFLYVFLILIDHSRSHILCRETLPFLASYSTPGPMAWSPGMLLIAPRSQNHSSQSRLIIFAYDVDVKFEPYSHEANKITHSLMIENH